MTGYEKDVMSVITISSIINVILTLILTPFWGIIGAAISNSISLIIAQYLMYRMVKGKMGIISHAFGNFF
jgi:O-antigen/teichoic acid export membrane protein